MRKDISIPGSRRAPESVENTKKSRILMQQAPIESGHDPGEILEEILNR